MDLKSEILFSIIVPTYNRATFIEKTINSVLAQSYSNFEIIVVDDGSTDNTKDIVLGIESTYVKYFKKENGERAAARNYGVSKARGDYLSFFDSDDLLYESHFQTALLMIKQLSNPEMFHLAYDIKTPSGKLIAEVYPPKNINKELVHGNCLSCNGVFLRKDVAFKNPFHENRKMAASEDYALWLHLGSQYPIYGSSTITSTIIQHDERSVVSMDRERLVLRQQLFLEYISNNPFICNKYTNELHVIKSNTLSYISLHLALMKNNRLSSLEYLYKSILIYPNSIFRKRTLAIFKHLLIP